MALSGRDKTYKIGSASAMGEASRRSISERTSPVGRAAARTEPARRRAEESFILSVIFLFRCEIGRNNE